MRILRAFPVLFLAAILALPACGPRPGGEAGGAASPGTAAGDSQAAIEGDTVKIGAYLPITGDAATFGEGTRTGMELAVARVNGEGGVLGKKIRILYEDTGGKTDQAAQSAQKLINQDKVLVLLGEVMSSNSLAVAPICQKAGVPMISPSSTNPRVTQVGDMIFRVCFTDEFQGEVIARFAAENLSARKAALLVDQSSDYSKGLAESFRETFTTRGGQVVAEEYYTQGDTDFSSVLNRLKGSTPDVLVVPGYYKEVGMIANQARQQGLDVPMLGGDGWDSPELTALGGAAIEGSYFSTHYNAQSPDPQVVAFVKAFREKAGEDPDSLSAMGYDAVLVMADAIKRAGSFDRKAIRDALAQTRGFPGLTGSITIDENRDAAKPAVILQVKDGKLVPVATVEPEGAATPGGGASPGTTTSPGDAAPPGGAAPPDDATASPRATSPAATTSPPPATPTGDAPSPSAATSPTATLSPAPTP